MSEVVKLEKKKFIYAGYIISTNSIKETLLHGGDLPQILLASNWKRNHVIVSFKKEKLRGYHMKFHTQRTTFILREITIYRFL